MASTDGHIWHNDSTASQQGDDHHPSTCQLTSLTVNRLSLYHLSVICLSNKQSHKDHRLPDSFHGMSRTGTSIRQKVTQQLSRAAVRNVKGMGSECSKDGWSLWEETNVLKLDSGNNYCLVDILKTVSTALQTSWFSPQWWISNFWPPKL